ncbi:hypothetical protein VNI00_002812 [Paramarasmius palmivorus]|uniref:Uncharacterized protein n=1 Tax=Paramarasmius palmivorus TaxID=297713 RepID=A0AAW0DZ77_9AGAR
METYATDETASSATTIWGPGTLSGKAIRSLGEASMRGAEKLLIRWKMAKIHQVLALDYYDAKVRHKALRMIMMQIGSGEIAQLTMCIMKWPRYEIRIFLSEMFTFMPLLWQDVSRPSDSSHTLRNQQELIAIYRTSQSSEEAHEIVPFLMFISHLSRDNHTARRAIIEAGFLEFLAAFHQHDPKTTTPSIAEARDILDVFVSDIRLQKICELHRLNLIWPSGNSSVPIMKYSREMANLTPNQRRVVWRKTERARIRERLCEIQVVMEMPAYLIHDCETDIFDMCFDLMTFYKLMTETNDWDSRQLSFELITKCIAINSITSKALRAVLALISFEENLSVFHRIVYSLLTFKIDNSNSPIAIQFSKEVHAHHPGVDPIDHFIDFAVSVASDSQTSAQAIIDADIFSLLNQTTHDPNVKGDLLGRFAAAADRSTQVCPPQSLGTYSD